MDRKLRIGFVSDSLVLKTGYGRYLKNLFPLLYKTGKYEIFHLCCGFPVEHPEFQRYPWKSFGVMTNFDQNRFMQDDSYRKFVSYGNCVIEDFVVKNKLDCLFVVNDIWALSLHHKDSNWFKFIKNNFVFQTTLDSLPILPQAKEWAKICPNFFSWSDFATKAMKSESSDFNHVSTLPGCIKSEEFFPINSNERDNLRFKFGIKPEEKVILYLGRNQLRKLFWANLEALAKFNKIHPEHKVKLLFHCSWAEPGGWPLDAIRKEVGLEKTDILTTYYCEKCKHWLVRSYEGENIQCPECKNATLKTCGIGSTITEEQLNLIYNISDASCSIFTSGGLEMTNIESLLAGIPLATVPYSSGEEFTDNNFVYSIDGTFTRECGTGFKKFVPNINSIVKFYKKICDLDPKERKEIAEKGRKWVIEHFDAKIIAQKVETFLDLLTPLNWDNFKASSNLKNPNAPFPQVETDEDFVKTLYQTIMLNTGEPKGVSDWLNTLKAGISREEVYKYFINVAQKENKQQQKVGLEELLDNNGKKRYLIVLRKSIGDLMMVSSLLKNLKERIPDYDVYFATEPQYFPILEGNSYIHKLIPFHELMDEELKMLGVGKNKGFFDGYCNLSFNTQINYNYIGRINPLLPGNKE